MMPIFVLHKRVLHELAEIQPHGYFYLPVKPKEFEEEFPYAYEWLAERRGDV